MLHRLMLKVTNFQLPTPKCFSTVVKNIFGGHHGPPMTNKVNPSCTREGGWDEPQKFFKLNSAYNQPKANQILTNRGLIDKKIVKNF